MGPLVVNRRKGLILAIATVAFIVIAACAPDARYRVLNFFFDGVPPPGAATQQASGEPQQGDLDAASANPEATSPTPKRTGNYAHPPFRNSQCDVCHNRRTGGMVTKPEDGLCATCHSKLWRSARYVHGPIAAQACLFCHHHHTSKHPFVLLFEPRELCSKCHNRDDLIQGEHHKAIDQDVCTKCHDPHSGADRFFLKRIEQ